MSIEPERSENIFPKLDEKNCQLQILVNYPFELKGERKDFPHPSKESLPGMKEKRKKKEKKEKNEERILKLSAGYGKISKAYY